MPNKTVDDYYKIFTKYINNVNNFYQEVARQYGSYKDKKLVCDENLLKTRIQEIIDANYGHILTPSYIFFLVDICTEEQTNLFEYTLDFNLQTVRNRYERLELVVYFLQKSVDEDSYPLTDYEREICEIYNNEVTKANKLHKMNFPEYFFMKDVLLIIAAQTLLDQKTPEELMNNLDYYATNWKDCLDDISMQIRLDLMNSKDQYNRTQLLDLLVGRLDSSHREIR